MPSNCIQLLRNDSQGIISMHCKLLLTLIMFFFSSMLSAGESLVLARAPQLAPEITSKLWAPFVKKLSEEIGQNIDLKVYTDRSSFESDIRQGEVDLYFGNPGYGVVGHLRHGYIPLLRSGKKLLQGIVVVRKDSGITNIEQLDGKTIAFPAETAFAASMYVRSLLANQFNIKYQTNFTGSHDNTYRAVLVGTAAAGGGVFRTFERESTALRDQLEVIFVTPGMKSHPLMAHPSVRKELRKRIQHAVLNMNKSNEGRKLLEKIKLQAPELANYKLDYKLIEPTVNKMYQHLLN